MELRNFILDVARSEIGYIEEAGNKTKYGVWFGLNGVAWCGIFVSWVYNRVGLPIRGAGFTKGFAGCQTMFEYALKNNLFTDKPQGGDIVLFDWNNDLRYDHVGLFVGSLNESEFMSIEGNTSLSNQSNGGQVMERKRNFKNAKFIKLIK